MACRIVDHGADEFGATGLPSFARTGLAWGLAKDSEAGPGCPGLYHPGGGLPSLGSRQPLRVRDPEGTGPAP